MEDPSPAAWLPAHIADADTGDRADPQPGWEHALARFAQASQLLGADPGFANTADLVAGYRHLMVLLAVGLDEALYTPARPALRVARTSTDDVLSWGMECPDGLYTHATMRGGETYRLWGNRGTARYVGLQTMDGIVSTANTLVDELEVDADGNFELVLSPEHHDGNWLALAGDRPKLVVRHFFYDWDTEVASTLHIERLGSPSADAEAPVMAAPSITGQLQAIGDFVYQNLKFFLDFGAAAQPNAFLPPFDGTAMGAAAESRPVIGRYQLGPDEALILEVEPPEGVYWSFSVGNPWWETIHYGRHQSSLNAHQAVIDGDGLVRAVISARDPGVANWLDNAGHSNGPIILRCVRTASAPTPSVRVVPFDEIDAQLPADTRRVSAAQRSATVANRLRAVQQRFAS